MNFETIPDTITNEEIDTNQNEDSQDFQNPEQPEQPNCHANDNQIQMEQLPPVRRHQDIILENLLNLFMKIDSILQPLFEAQGTLRLCDFAEALTENGIHANAVFILAILDPNSYVFSILPSYSDEKEIKDNQEAILLTPITGWSGPSFERKLNALSRASGFRNRLRMRFDALHLEDLKDSAQNAVLTKYIAGMLRKNPRMKNMTLMRIGWLNSEALEVIPSHSRTATNTRPANGCQA